MLFTLARFSPYEWKNHNLISCSCTSSKFLVENEWTLLNSFWFTLVKLLKQGK